MALNLSTLTSSATSGDVLAEALTTADFLEGVPVLRNLARGSQKGGDAKQDVALNQPKALPLIDGDGYLYCSGVNNNCAVIPDESALDVSGDLTLEADVTLPSYPPAVSTRIISKYYTTGNQRSYLFYVSTSGHLGLVLSSTGSYQSANEITSSLTLQYVGISQGQRVKLKAVWRASDGRLQFFYKIKGGDYTQLGTDRVNSAGSIYNGTASVVLGGDNEGSSSAAQAAIHSAKIYASINDTNKVLDVDFTATNVRHGDTKFKCATGQVVTINKSGNDPATIIKKPVLRFDGTNDFLSGVFNQTITGSSIFMAYSVVGDGEANARLLGLNSTGVNDVDAGGYFLARDSSTTNVRARYNGGSNIVIHAAMYDDALGDVLLEADIKNGSQISKLNNANQANGTTTVSGDLSSEEFKIASFTTGGSNAAIDLEYLALFPASITDDQADSVRNYINNRNNVFDLKDGFGYYFFDPQSITDSDLSGATNRLTGSWEGRIVGSDNGDTSRSAYNGTEDDQPTSDKYTLTFADNTDNLSFSITQAGWQIVGTSLGTFAYRVNANAVTELNLLGNLGNASYRKAGDLYGVILLPESATGADIESARKLLIDRGAADGVSGSSLNQFFRGRTDILEFNFVNTAGVTDMSRAWQDAGLTKFALLDTSSVTNLNSAFANCNLASFPLIDCSSVTQMGFAFYNNNFSDFPAIQAPVCNNFSGGWQNCSALTSFPAGAKLGTSASNVNFTEAWRSSGLLSFNTNLPTGQNFTSCWRQSALTSFGAIDLSAGTTFTLAWQQAVDLVSFGAIDARNGTNFQEAWRDCSALTSFPAAAKLGTSANNVNFSSAWMSSGLTSFPDDIDLSKGGQFLLAWFNTNLTSFSTPITGVDAKRMRRAWKDCSQLTDFSYDVLANWNPSYISSGVFDGSWSNCPLTAQSVENILTSIDASGQYATSTGASGGTALGNNGIDIDYNTATGSLSAATNTAVTSLKSKGWSIIVNNVTL